MDVREVRPADVPQIARLFYQTIHAVNACDYTAGQIEAWAPRIYERSFWLDRWTESCTVLVADDGGTIAGFAELRHHGEVDCCYVHHRYLRRRVGTRLLVRIEQEAWHLGLDRLSADVSITARPFFSASGFTVVNEQLKQYRNQSFRQYLMERRLR